MLCKYEGIKTSRLKRDACTQFSCGASRVRDSVGPCNGSWGFKRPRPMQLDSFFRHEKKKIMKTAVWKIQKEREFGAILKNSEALFSLLPVQRSRKIKQLKSEDERITWRHFPVCFFSQSCLVLCNYNVTYPLFFLHVILRNEGFWWTFCLDFYSSTAK